MSKDYLLEFIKCMESVDRSKHNFEIFQDFLIMASASFNNAIVKDENVEKEYMEVVQRYKDVKPLCELLAITTMALEQEMHDFLGEVYMSAGFGNKHNGQFFTPYHMSLCMAKMLIGEYVENEIKEKGYYTLSEPCCGAGGMIIAFANTLLDKGYNPQKIMKFLGTDIDIGCCRMAYIQTSLLGLKGDIVHGNTLSLEIWRKFTTPMSYLTLAA